MLRLLAGLAIAGGAYYYFRGEDTNTSGEETLSNGEVWAWKLEEHVGERRAFFGRKREGFPTRWLRTPNGPYETFDDARSDAKRQISIRDPQTTDKIAASGSVWSMRWRVRLDGSDYVGEVSTDTDPEWMRAINPQPDPLEAKLLTFERLAKAEMAKNGSGNDSPIVVPEGADIFPFRLLFCDLTQGGTEEVEQLDLRVLNIIYPNTNWPAQEGDHPTVLTTQQIISDLYAEYLADPQDFCRTGLP